MSTCNFSSSVNPAINDLQLGQLLQKCITKNTFSACEDLSQGRSVISLAKISTILLNAIDYSVDSDKLQQFLLKYFNFKSSNQLCNWKRILGALQKSASPPKRTQLSEFLPLEMKPYAAQINQECKKWDLNMIGEIDIKKFKKIVSKKCQLEINDSEFIDFCKSYNPGLNNDMINYADLFKKLGFEKKRLVSSAESGMRSNDCLELRKIERKFRSLMIKKYNEILRAIQAADRFQEGYLPIEQMQAFLSEIVMPEMAETTLFKQILSMCGIKATGRIDWFKFLAKFKQTPVGIRNLSSDSLNQRGLTIPINSSKRNYPIHTIQRVNTEQEVMDTFWKYLLANFDCSRVAYLHMDMNNNGLLETHELKEFFDIKFPNLRTNETVIKNVLTRFDPHHTGKITGKRNLKIY